jgi:hypothetical protein
MIGRRYSSDTDTEDPIDRTIPSVIARIRIEIARKSG